MGQAAAGGGGGGGSDLPLSGGQMTGDILIVTNDYDKPSVRIGPYETGVSVWGNTKVGIISNGTGVAGFSSSTTVGAMLKATLPLSWSSQYINGAPDLLLYRGGSGILSQRNGANAQESQLFLTYTDASNHTRYFERWSGNLLLQGVEYAGTGTVAGGVVQQVNGVDVLSWSDGAFNQFTHVLSKERSAAAASVATWAQSWVKNSAPNESWFTDDAGNDQLVSKVGIQRTVQLQEVLTSTSPSDGESEENEVTMHTFAIPAGELATNGDKLIFRARGSCISTNATAPPSYRVVVDGATVINTYDFGNDQDSDWRVDLEVIRISSTSLTICVLATLCADSSHAATEHRSEVVTEAVTDLAANAFNIVVYGTNDGGANDVIQRYLEIVSIKTY